MKKILSIVLSVLLTITLFPTLKLNAEGEVAQIDEKKYTTIAEAVAAYKEGDTIELLTDASYAGSITGTMHFGGADYTLIATADAEISGGVFDCKVESNANITGGTFTKIVTVNTPAKIRGGTFTNKPSEDDVASDCTIVGDVSPYKVQFNYAATAEVVTAGKHGEVENDVEYKFNIDPSFYVSGAAYLNNACDFRITTSAPMDSADFALNGHYKMTTPVSVEYDWQPFSGLAFTKGESKYLDLKVDLGAGDLPVLYSYLIAMGQFDCGISNKNPIKNSGKTITVDLVMKDANGKVMTILASQSYTFPTAEAAQIDNTKYASLQDAINAVPTDGTEKTITVLCDIDLGYINKGMVTKPGQKFTIDLNEKTVQSKANDKSVSYLLLIDGSIVTIKNGTMIHSPQNADCQPTPGYASNTITVGAASYGGELYLEDCTIVNNGDFYACYPVDLQGYTIGGKATITNSTITGVGATAIRLDVQQVGTAPELVINSGTFSGGDEGSIWVDTEGASDTTPTKLTIKGGTFNANSSAQAVRIGGPKQTANPIEVNISGGTFLGSIKFGHRLNDNDILTKANISAGLFEKIELQDNSKKHDYVQVVGGYYKTTPVAFVSSNCQVIDTPEGTEKTNGYVYTVVDKAVAQIGENKYETLAAAISAVQNNETIEILCDIPDAVGMTINNGKTFTIDFGTHTYTVGKPGAGSTGTATQGFQILKGSNVTFKNGTIQVDPQNKDVTWPANANVKGIAWLINNYGNMTIENMTINGENLAHNYVADGGQEAANTPRYVIYNNTGSAVVNNSVITAATGDVAISSNWYNVASYPDRPVVTISGTKAATENGMLINGKVEAIGGTININSGTRVDGQVRVGENKSGSIIDATVTIAKNALVDPQIDYPVVVFGNNTLNVYGKVVCSTNNTDDCAAIATNGNAYNAGSKINIYEGAEITSSTKGNAIYMPNGELNISGGTIAGPTAVYFKSTKLNITGGSLEGNGAKANYVYNGNGGNPTGDALVIDSCNYPNGIDSVSISGGYFKSINNNAVKAFTSQGATAVTGFITGGYYSSSPDASYLAVSKKVVDNADGTYKFAIDEIVHVDPISEQEIVNSIPGYNELTKEQKEVVENKVNNEVESITNNTGVTSDFDTEIVGLVDNDKIKENHGATSVGDTTINVKLNTIGVTSNPDSVTDVKVEKVVYDIKPVATITKGGQEETVNLTNADLSKSGKVTVRLGVPTTNATKALIVHKSEDYATETFKADIKSDTYGQYVLVEMSHFSTVEVNVMNEGITTVAEINGTPYTSLAEAIDAANASGSTKTVTIKLLDDCNENIDKNVSVMISIDGSSKTMSGKLKLTGNEKDITVKNLVVINNGLDFAKFGTVKVQNSTIKNITGKNRAGYEDGILVEESNVATITGNTIENIDEVGIDCRDIKTSVTIENNTIKNTDHNSVQVVWRYDATPITPKATITGNTFENWGLGGEGRALRARVNVLEFTGNKMINNGAPEEFVKLQGSTEDINVSKNYWNGYNPTGNIGDSKIAVYSGVGDNKENEIRSYYTDNTMENLVALVTHKVTYILGGSVYKEETVIHGDKISYPTIPSCYKSPAVWYIDQGCKTKFTWSNPVKEDMTLYKNDLYTWEITKNSDGSVSYSDTLSLSAKGCYKLLKDCTNSNNIALGTAITNFDGYVIDLNSHTWTLSYSKGNQLSIKGSAGTLTFKNGTIKSTAPASATYAVMCPANKNTSICFENDLTIESHETVIIVDKNVHLTTSANIVVDGANQAVIQTNGSTTTSDSQISITGGSIESNNVGIYLPAGNLNVSGGTITGTTAVEVRAGSVNISGGKLVATGEFSEKENPNGSTITGAALAVSQHTTNKDIEVSITGGEFEGAKAFYEIDLEDETSNNINTLIKNGTFTGSVESENISEFIEGGTFSSPVKEEYCAKGYVPVSNGNGTYSVANCEAYIKPIDPVTYYKNDVEYDFLAFDYDNDALALAKQKWIIDFMTPSVEPSEEGIEAWVSNVSGYLYNPCDFRITVDDDVAIGDFSLNGQYSLGEETFEWQSFGDISLTKDTPTKLGLNSYDKPIVYGVVLAMGKLECGISNLKPANNSGKTLTVELVMIDENCGEVVLASQSYTFPEVGADDVACVDGVYYKSLESAIDAATTNHSTVKMIADDLTVDAGKALVIDDGITLDLNGHNVNVKYLSVFGGQIIDTADNNLKGILNASKKFSYPQSKVQDNKDNVYNTYMPVETVDKDGNPIGYKFYKIKIGWTYVSKLTGSYEDDDGATRRQAVFGSYISVKDGATDKTILLSETGNVEFGVKVIADAGKLNLTPEGESKVDQNNSTITMDIVYSNNLVKKYVEAKDDSTPGITWTGISNIDSITINGFAKSSSSDFRYDGKCDTISLLTTIDNPIVEKESN